MYLYDKMNKLARKVKWYINMRHHLTAPKHVFTTLIKQSPSL